jgi:hypothetical protein
MVQQQHNVAEPIPPFYIRTLSSMEASLNSAIVKEKDAKKKMNATNAKALTAMKQKVKKAAKEYEKEIKEFQAVRAPRSDRLYFIFYIIDRIPKPLNANTQLRLLQNPPCQRLLKNKGRM